MPAEQIKSEVWECRVCGDEAPCRVEIKFTDNNMPAYLRGQPLFREQRRCITGNERHADFELIRRDGIDQPAPTRRIVLEDEP